MDQVMFIEIGTGTDLHGQNITKACVRAVENAIRYNSMPGIRTVLPENDLSKMQVEVTLAVPTKEQEIDLNQVRAILPYGQVHFRVVPGGLVTTSGIVLPDKGDQNDELYVVVAAVQVGYNK